MPKFSDLISDKKDLIVEMVMKLKRDQMRFGQGGMIAKVVIDDDGNLSQHWFSSPDETLRGIFEGYMMSVATIPPDDITEGYESDGGDATGLTDDEKVEWIETCWEDNRQDIESQTWEELQELIHLVKDSEVYE